MYFHDNNKPSISGPVQLSTRLNQFKHTFVNIHTQHCDVPEEDQNGQ